MPREPLLLFPFVWVLGKVSEAVVKILGGGKTAKQSITEEDLLAMVSISAESGAIAKREKEMIKGLLELDDTRVEAIMNAQNEIIGINENKENLITGNFRNRYIAPDGCDLISWSHNRW